MQGLEPLAIPRDVGDRDTSLSKLADLEAQRADGPITGVFGPPPEQLALAFSFVSLGTGHLSGFSDRVPPDA